MPQLTRLLKYIRPYWLQFFLSVILMAIVGLLDAFRVLLIGPIFDQVLNPGAPPQNITLFQRFPGLQHAVYLQQLMPKYWHNPLSVVAAALVGATIIKGLCDYVGTYLVSYAGYGLVTDLRNDLYPLIQVIAQVGHQPVSRIADQVCPYVIAQAFDDRRAHQGRGHNTQRIVPILGHELLKIDGVLEAGKSLEQRNVLRRRAGIQNLIKDWADQQHTEGIEQAHDGHENDRK